MQKLIRLFPATDRETGEEKTDKNGNTFYNGTMGNVRVMGFWSSYKDKNTGEDVNCIDVCIPNYEKKED